MDLVRTWVRSHLDVHVRIWLCGTGRHWVVARVTARKEKISGYCVLRLEMLKCACLSSGVGHEVDACFM